MYNAWLVCDAKNQLVKSSRETAQGTVSIAYIYDALGRVAAQTDEEGNTRHIAYDALGRVKTVTNPFGLSPQDLEQSEAQEHWGWHAFLDILGVVPVVGGIASGINGALYLSEGNTAQAIAEFCFAGASLILPCTKLFRLSENGVRAVHLTARVLKTGGCFIGAYSQLQLLCGSRIWQGGGKC